ncbi:MAG: hypothetical protein Q4D38_05715 [Planctomycetia bacterium]|nr:hypothetical protein [Planctomycetia bacterium]
MAISFLKIVTHFVYAVQIKKTLYRRNSAQTRQDFGEVEPE